MSSLGRPRGGGGMFGGFLGREDDFDSPAPLAGSSRKPPKVWGVLEVREETLVAELSGWRAVMAFKQRVEVPLRTVKKVEHDPAARSHIQAKLRKRAGRNGLFRVGPYHSIQGWSFWSIGLGRNAVVVETNGARWRYIVIEVEDPKATVEQLQAALGASAKAAHAGSPPPPPGQ